MFHSGNVTDIARRSRANVPIVATSSPKRADNLRPIRGSQRLSVSMTKMILRVFVLTMLATGAALAQTPAPAGADAPASAPPLTAAEAKRALDVLNDADKRAQLIDTLQTVAKASAPAAAAAPHAGP